MATLKVLLRDYVDKDGMQQIAIRVEHAGRQRLIPVGHKIPAKHWQKGKVIKHPHQAIINSAIASKEAEIKRYFADCEIHKKTIYLDLIGTGNASYSFAEYLDYRAAQYKAAGKIVMDRKVRRFALEIREAFGVEVYFDDVNPDWLRRLEQYHIDNGNVENTRHKKFKFLGEFFGHAIDEGKASAPNPFKKYKIVTKPVKKEKLTSQHIAAIEALKLKPGAINNARNIFLFSYYAKGQRFEVCVTLKGHQIADGRIHFRTNKGSEYLSVKIHSRLQGILDQYPQEEFVFPYIKEIPDDPESYLNMISSANASVNRDLKTVGRLAKISLPLTMHLARHSFAFHLKKTSDNINVISDALGHSDQRITQAYLKALEDDFLDGEMEKLYGK